MSSMKQGRSRLLLIFNLAFKIIFKIVQIFCIFTLKEEGSAPSRLLLIFSLVFKIIFKVVQIFCGFPLKEDSSAAS